MRRKSKTRRYVVHTATKRYICLACGVVISIGERYTRRRYRNTLGDYITLAKCRECVPIRER